MHKIDSMTQTIKRIINILIFSSKPIDKFILFNYNCHERLARACLIASELAISNMKRAIIYTDRNC